jgi:hypothetical protein
MKQLNDRGIERLRREDKNYGSEKDQKHIKQCHGGRGKCSLSEQMRGSHDTLKFRPSSLFILLELCSNSIASMMGQV